MVFDAPRWQVGGPAVGALDLNFNVGERESEKSRHRSK